LNPVMAAMRNAGSKAAATVVRTLARLVMMATVTTVMPAPMSVRLLPAGMARAARTWTRVKMVLKLAMMAIGWRRMRV
jgi:hypothetical protein